SWNTPAGASALSRIVAARIPAWRNRLTERQALPILRILDGQDVLLCTKTGDGKSALFLVPLLCHLEVSAKPEEYPRFKRDICSNPVGVVVTPTKGLARNIVDSAQRFGLEAIAYDRETIRRAFAERRNLTAEISACEKYKLVCIDPEHLRLPGWREILDTPTFQQNVIQNTIDEAHLVRDWRSFRSAYGSVGSILRSHLPEAPVVALSATLEPGEPTNSLYKTLGFAYNFTEFRFSNERLDIQFIIEPLAHGLKSRTFPQLLQYLDSGRKTVVFAPTLEIVTRIYTYLFNMEPPGVDHGRRVRTYTALCDPEFNAETLRLAKEDDQLQIIVATVALANGVDCDAIQDSISIGMPSTLAQMEQQAGRARGANGATGRAVVLVQKKDINHAKKQQAARASAASVASSTGRKQKGAPKDPMEDAKAQLLTETCCLNCVRNRIWQNSPLVDTSRSCKDASRPLACSLCAARENLVISFPPGVSVYAPFTQPPRKPRPFPIPRDEKLKKEERPIVTKKLSDFGVQLFASERDRPEYRHRPPSWFFPPSLQKRLADRVLRFTSLEHLQITLTAAKWRFHQHSSVKNLWNVIQDLQQSIVNARPKEPKKTRKRATA
ncbi:P-loop containing nucleoside triphosphate hydrolase protein, partial [Mycena pura]